MAVGVYSRPNTPSGPARDSSRYTPRPTTTGGRPISAFRKTMTGARPGKRRTPTAAPRVMPMTQAENTAVRLTDIDNPTISIRFASAV